MIKRLLLILGIALAVCSQAFSQGAGSLFGTVTDRESGEPIPFANVAVVSSGVIVTGTQTDFDGKYAIRAINPGSYSLRVSCVGYQASEITGIVIGADKSVPMNVTLKSTDAEIEGVEIIAHKIPVFEPDQTSSGAIVTAEEISRMPNRSAEGVVTSVSGVFSRDGEIGSIRGTREGAQAMFIDGMRVTDLTGIPPSAYEQVATTLSGVSSRYGDVTSGVINITTRGASRVFGMGVEAETSQFLDPYGYNSVGLNLNGPIWVKKNKETGTSRSIMGYFLSGQFQHNADGWISAVGWDRLSDDQIDYLKQNPLTGLASGRLQQALFIDPNDIDHYKKSRNTSNYRVNAVGRLTISPTQNLDITFGGNFTYYKGKDASLSYSLMNWENFGAYTSNTYRVYGRLTQRFPTKPDSKSLFKNFYYTIQADFERSYNEYENEKFEDNVFEYGYIGKYDAYMTPTFEYQILEEVGPEEVMVQNAYSTYYIDYSSGESNPDLAIYNEYLLGEGYSFPRLEDIQAAGGLLNGELPSSIYGMYAAPGVPFTYYGKNLSTKWNIDASGSIDIGGHQVRLGFQYEQRNSSTWSMSNYLTNGAVGIWTLMRQATNKHILELETNNPIYTGDDIHSADTIYYGRRYNYDLQAMFDWNLRNALGRDKYGTDYILVDSYDPLTKEIAYYDQNNIRQVEVLKDGLDLSFFSPDDLFQSGNNSLISYRGYTYDGKKLTTNPTLNDFFHKQVTVNGRSMHSREIAPYSPTYIAGWIEDKFTFNDIIFTLGVRVDGFDANQMVLKDNYLLYNAYTVKDMKDGKTPFMDNIPANMGNDYVIYVDDIANPNAIKGYRNGSTWYNDKGVEINDPTTEIGGSKGIAPYLTDSKAIENKNLNVNAFEDYKTQVNAMPRISFSFPISDEALFFAHYDILTRRPTNIAMDPLNYLFFTQRTGLDRFINNPGLKPTQTIDYELGFKQKLTNNSALSLSAFYKEIRNEVQVYRFTGAYPDSYSSYNNIDFGTTKGITLDYDLRRTKNIRLRAGYTLQFASGTGSDASTQQGLIAAQLPNLRTVIPMDYDRRHQFNIAFDYRFSSGKDYNGPVAKREKKGKSPVQILSNTGLSVTLMGGSGTPYTRQSNVTSAISGGTKYLTGTMNGSRMPWEFRIDAKLDKDFNFEMGRRKNGEKRLGSINVYLACNNILNKKNILGVYSFTGLPDDDGFLTAAEYQQQINAYSSPETFSALYALWINRPDHYSSPRTLRLGLIFSFF